MPNGPFTIVPPTGGAPAWDDPEYTRPPGGQWGAGRVLGTLYLAVLALAAALWIWTTSVAGYRFIGLMISFYLFALLGLVWLGVAVVAMVRAVGSSRRPGKVLWLPPLVVVALAVLTTTAVPTRVRFEFARAEFDAYALEVLTAAEDIEVWATYHEPAPEGRDRDLQSPDVPESLGGIPLRSARVVPEGLLIYDADGNGFDDAGYAYLPYGEFPPSTGEFESPSFRSLGGDWYAFTSSW